MAQASTAHNTACSFKNGKSPNPSTDKLPSLEGRAGDGSEKKYRAIFLDFSADGVDKFLSSSETFAK
jgi:hypothetical protein